jgi:hypothetical protein
MKRIDIGGIAVSAPHLDALPRRGRALGLLTAAILCVATLSQPIPAHAAHGGGGGHGGGGHGGGFGGFHGGGGGGGFHGGGFGGFHGSAFHGGGFHRGAFHGGGFHAGGFYGGGWDDGLGWGYDSAGYGWDNPLSYNQATAPQSWYYCTNPAGYYPYVTQCSVAWQPVPAG